MSSHLTVIIALVAGIWLLVALAYSRQAVWLLLVWLPIQGWIQLNLLGDSSATVLLYEYQVIGIYIVFAFRILRSPQAFGVPPIMRFAVPFTIWAMLLVPFSIATNGLLVTLLGLRTYLLPLPLVWIGYHAFQNRRQLENLGGVLMLQLPFIAAITALQVISLTSASGTIFELPTGFTVATVIRPPGTFSAPGQLGMYLLFSIPLAIGLLGLDAKLWKRACFVIGLVGAIVALMANTQRATMVLLSVTLPVALWLARRVRGIVSAGVAVAVVVTVTAAGNPVISGGFLDRVGSISENLSASLVVVPTQRLQDALQMPWRGGGLGIASPGGPRLATASSRAGIMATGSSISSESFMAAVIYQVGVPGLLLFYLFIFVLMLAGLRAVRMCRRSDMALLAAVIFGFEIAICLQSWTYDPLHYPPSRVLFWFWAGVLLDLPRLAFADGRALPERLVAQRGTTGPPRRLVRPSVPATARRSTW